MFDLIGAQLLSHSEITSQRAPRSFHWYTRGMTEERIQGEFKFGFFSDELQEEIRRVHRETPIRLRYVFVVRNVHTNLCAVFANAPDACRRIGIYRSATRRRLICGYEHDDVWQFARIPTPETRPCDVFEPPLQMYDVKKWRRNDALAMVHLRAHNLKTGEELIFRGLKPAALRLQLSNRAIFNLLLNPGQPMYFTDWVMHFATFEDIARIVPNYIPRRTRHKVIKAESSQQALDGMYEVVYGRTDRMPEELMPAYWRYCVDLNKRNLPHPSRINKAALRRYV